MSKRPLRLLSVRYKLTLPCVTATSWNGWGMTTGTCSVHSWNDNATEDEGDPPLAKSYNSQLRPMTFESPEDTAPGRSSRGLRSRAVRASELFADDDDDEPLVW